MVNLISTYIAADARQILGLVQYSKSETANDAKLPNFPNKPIKKRSLLNSEEIPF
jgi:hypothetical protein